MPYTDTQSPAAIESRRLSNQKYHRLNKKSHQEKVKKTKEAFRRWAEDLKRDRPCVDCQRRFPPCCMDWHHKDPSTKVDTVGRITATGNKSRVLAEIIKCELVCSNCHRIRTFG
jgi:hypothetical protein